MTDLKGITDRSWINGEHMGEQNLSSLPDTARYPESHPNTDCPKLSRFHFLTECCNPAFDNMKPILAFYGETL